VVDAAPGEHEHHHVSIIIAGTPLEGQTRTISFRQVVNLRANATVDWDRKEPVLASLRRHIRRPRTKYRYPPDKQEAAVQLVMQQAELLAADVMP
jgi:hypothetical protein